jgi:MraZ protein
VVFRDELAAGVVVRPGRGGCVQVYARPTFEQHAEELRARVSALTPDGEDEQRDFFGDAYGGKLDGQGRLLLPPQVRAIQPLDGAVSVVGCGVRLEIWVSSQLSVHKRARRARRESLAAAGGAA